VRDLFAVAAEEIPAEPTPAMEPEHFPTERIYEIPELQINRAPLPVLLPNSLCVLGGMCVWESCIGSCRHLFRSCVSPKLLTDSSTACSLHPCPCLLYKIREDQSGNPWDPHLLLILTLFNMNLVLLSENTSSYPNSQNHNAWKKLNIMKDQHH